MEIQYIWIGLAVILLLLELWAINTVLRSTGGVGEQGFVAGDSDFCTAVRLDCLGDVRAQA